MRCCRGRCTPCGSTCDKSIPATRMFTEACRARSDSSKPNKRPHPRLPRSFLRYSLRRRNGVLQAQRCKVSNTLPDLSTLASSGLQTYSNITFVYITSDVYDKELRPRHSSPPHIRFPDERSSFVKSLGICDSILMSLFCAS